MPSIENNNTAAPKPHTGVSAPSIELGMMDAHKADIARYAGARTSAAKVPTDTASALSDAIARWHMYDAINKAYEDYMCGASKRGRPLRFEDEENAAGLAKDEALDEILTLNAYGEDAALREKFLIDNDLVCIAVDLAGEWVKDHRAEKDTGALSDLIAQYDAAVAVYKALNGKDWEAAVDHAADLIEAVTNAPCPTIAHVKMKAAFLLDRDETLEQLDGGIDRLRNFVRSLAGRMDSATVSPTNPLSSLADIIERSRLASNAFDNSASAGITDEDSDEYKALERASAAAFDAVVNAPSDDA